MMPNSSINPKAIVIRQIADANKKVGRNVSQAKSSVQGLVGTAVQAANLHTILGIKEPANQDGFGSLIELESPSNLTSACNIK